MPMFRRMPGKPIEARQWTLSDGDAFKIDDYPMVQFDHSTGRCYIETMHAGQRVYLEKGDWILPEPDGVHFYPCKPDVFAATYEAVDAPRQPTDIHGNPTTLAAMDAAMGYKPNG